MSPLLIMNTKTSHLRTFSAGVCDGYMCVGYIHLSQSSGLISIQASEEISVIYICHFHMEVVYFVKDIHKSLCLQKGREI